MEDHIEHACMVASALLARDLKDREEEPITPNVVINACSEAQSVLMKLYPNQSYKDLDPATLYTKVLDINNLWFN